MLRHDVAAASAPFSFAIAGVVFVVSIGSALLAMDTAGHDRSASDQQNLSHRAEAILEQFVARPGIGWSDGADWLTEPGLLADNGSGIDRQRMQALKGAVFEAQPNGKLDYAESLALLGLDPHGPGHFHLRIAPIGLPTVLTDDLSRIRTAYIADAVSFSLSLSVSTGSDEQMAAEARVALEARLDEAGQLEREALRALGLGYDDRIHLRGAGIAVESLLSLVPLDLAVSDTRILLGDLFLDQKQYLDLVLGPHLGAYDLLVVGSNVDHSALTAAHVKGTISDWVQAGGTLIVFGSDSKSFKWLESTMGVGIETVNGGAYAPDVDHPVLTEPYRLDWPVYGTFDQAWGGKSDKSNGGKSFDDLFQHVIGAGDGDVLAISKDGAFGSGRVFLTTFRATDIAADLGVQESMRMINNLVVYADRSELFLDYGPPPSQSQSVGAATMTSHVWDPRLGQVPVRVVVLAWGV